MKKTSLANAKLCNVFFHLPISIISVIHNICTAPFDTSLILPYAIIHIFYWSSAPLKLCRRYAPHYPTCYCYYFLKCINKLSRV